MTTFGNLKVRCVGSKRRVAAGLANYVMQLCNIVVDLIGQQFSEEVSPDRALCS